MTPRRPLLDDPDFPISERNFPAQKPIERKPLASKKAEAEAEREVAEMVLRSDRPLSQGARVEIADALGAKGRGNQELTAWQRANRQLKAVHYCNEIKAEVAHMKARNEKSRGGRKVEAERRVAEANGIEVGVMCALIARHRKRSIK